MRWLNRAGWPLLSRVGHILLGVTYAYAYEEVIRLT